MCHVQTCHVLAVQRTPLVMETFLLRKAVSFTVLAQSITNFTMGAQNVSPDLFRSSSAHELRAAPL